MQREKSEPNFLESMMIMDADICEDPNSSHVTEEYWTLKGSLVHGQITAAFVILFVVVGLPWNILTAITILKNKLYSQPTILFLLDLTVTDILVLIFSLPVLALTGISGEYILGHTDEQRCKSCLLGVIPGILFLNSLFIVMLMSVDRFVYIYKPFLYERKATKPAAALVIVGTFALNILVSIPFVTQKRKITFSSELIGCNVNFSRSEWPLILMMAVVCLSLVVIIVCNIWTVCIVQKNIWKVYGVRNSRTKINRDEFGKNIRKKRHQKELHMFRVFGGLLLSNLIAWVPLIIIIMLYVVGVQSIPISIITVTHILFLSQVAFHPMIETTLISDVREPMKAMVTCGLLKEKYPDKTIEDALALCLCSKSKRDGECSCRSLWKLFNAALLPQDSANNTGHARNQSEEMVQNEYGLVELNKLSEVSV